MAGMREFAFKHALTRDVVYATLPRPERRELHRRVAEWIQEVAPDRSAETAELAAYHYGQALAYGEDDPAVRGGPSSAAGRERGIVQPRGPSTPREPSSTAAVELAADDRQRAAAELALARVDVMEALFDTALERLARARDAAGARRSPSSAPEALALALEGLLAHRPLG